MIFIKNCKEIVTDKLMDFLRSHDGDTVPVWQPNRWKGHPMLDAAREKARVFENNSPLFQQFNEKTKDIANFKIELPDIPEDNRKRMWWIIKLKPGQMQSMHFDPHLIDVKNPQRYSIFLEDWKPGHIFTWDDKMIANYSAGDMYRWSDPMCYHGCTNIGYENRYTLQITTFD
jgi:hypothetical protein